MCQSLSQVRGQHAKAILMANMARVIPGALLPLITVGKLAREGEEVNSYAIAPPVHSE